MGRRRTVLPLGAAVAVAVMAIAAGQWPDSAAGDNVYVSAAGQPTASSIAVQAQADQVFESFNGTVRQREAGGVLQAWALNGAMDACMEDAGFPEWDWSATRNGAPRTNALAPSKFFAKPLAAAHSSALTDMAERLLAEHELRVEVLTEAEDAAVGVCLKRTPPTPETEASALSTPALVEDLRAAWWSMLDTLDEDLGDETAYDACISAGARALGEQPLAGGAWQQGLAAAAPGAKDLPRGDASGASGASGRVAWVRFIDLESKWEQKDWGCRRDTYGARLGEVKEAVEAFSRDHATEIEAARLAWRGVVRRAASLGFHGQAGSLDRAEPGAPAPRS